MGTGVEGSASAGGSTSPHPHGGAHEQPRVLSADHSPSQLNDLDLHLIRLLQADGRIPFAELARRTGATEKTVRRRVGRLLDEAYIQISAVTDPALLGWSSMALVCVTVDGSVPTSEIADRLARIPQVDYVTCTAGRFAVQAEVVCVDAADLQQVLDDRIRTAPGVRDVEVLSYLRLHYQQARFAGVAPDGDGGGVRPRVLDDVDRRIVARLAIEGRAPFSELSQALGVSETMVRQRFQRLTTSGAVKVMCIANPLRLGFRSVGWIGVRASAGARAVDIAEALTRLPAVTYVVVTAGRFDVLAEAVCTDAEHFLALVDDSVRAIDGVADLELWMYQALRYKPLQPRLD